MIKKEFDHTSKSYWRNNELYDSERTKRKKVKIFGLTIWEYNETFRCDLVSEQSENIGFKVKNGHG
jgi:hypothetical protein